MEQALTDTPTALASLTVGTIYTVQNQSGKTMKVLRAQAAPATADRAFRVRPGGVASVSRQTAADEIYVWIGTAELGGGTGVAFYDESA